MKRSYCIFTSLLSNLSLISDYSLKISSGESFLIQIRFAFLRIRRMQMQPLTSFSHRPCHCRIIHILFLLWLMILYDCGAEWWWNPSIIHHIYGWPRFGCWGPRGSSRKKIVAGHGGGTNRTTQTLSLSFTCYHQLQAASWCGSLQSRSEY